MKKPNGPFGHSGDIFESKKECTIMVRGTILQAIKSRRKKLAGRAIRFSNVSGETTVF